MEVLKPANFTQDSSNEHPQECLNDAARSSASDWRDRSHRAQACGNRRRVEWTYRAQVAAPLDQRRYARLPRSRLSTRGVALGAAMPPRSSMLWRCVGTSAWPTKSSLQNPRTLHEHWILGLLRCTESLKGR